MNDMAPLTIISASNDIYDHMFYAQKDLMTPVICIFSSAECEESAILLCWPIVQSHEGKSAL